MHATISIGRNDESTTPRRRWFLDWLRIGAFALLVVYHVGMVYSSGAFHVKSDAAGPWLDPWMRLSSPWRMSLLFVISGAATACMLASRGASRASLRERATRLLLPLAFGIAVIVPPQAFVQVREQFGYVGSYLDFLGLYLTGYGGFCNGGTLGMSGGCLILPTWNHLWFLPYLFTYTVAFWLIERYWPIAPARAGRWLLERSGAVAWLLFPVALLSVLRWMLAARFPLTRTLIDDPFGHAQYLLMFAIGIVLVRTPGSWSRLEQLRWAALALAAVGWSLSVLPTVMPGLVPWVKPIGAILVSLQQWGAVVAAIGFAQRHLDRDSRARAVLTNAVFPVYVLHQSILVLLVPQLRPLALSVPVEASLLVGATLALAMAGYAVARRLPGIGPLIGLAPSGRITKRTRSSLWVSE